MYVEPLNVDNMARPGRPRKQGPRYKNGRLKPRKDLGTDELRAKKVALVGPDGDPTKSTNVIDILQSWGHQTSEESKALHYFVRVRSLMIGKAAFTASCWPGFISASSHLIQLTVGSVNAD